jgi:hypothetical protein
VILSSCALAEGDGCGAGMSARGLCLVTSIWKREWALGEKLCQSPEEFKAWSQNLGHEKVLTTFMSYGSVAGERQADILNELSRKTVDGVDSGEPDETTIRRVLGYLHKKAS